MKKIKRQFGAEFAEALAKCPTLVADLNDIRANGVKIRRVGGHCQAYSIHAKKSIYIGTKCSLSYQLISFAHEKVHVLVSPTPNPVPGKTSRKAFIDMCLDAETDAIVHEVQVVSELLAAGYKVDSHSMKWYRRFKNGGRAAVRRAIEDAVTSNTGEKYPEYYGGWYDEAVRPDMRIPLHRLSPGTSCSIDVPTLDVYVTRRKACGHKDGRDLCPRFVAACDQPTERLNIDVRLDGKPTR